MSTGDQDRFLQKMVRLAVPSEAPGGLAAEPSGHFGHCYGFTLVDIRDGAVAGTRVVPNVPHEQGGCMAPVQALAAEGVAALVVHGMGLRPLQGFAQVGIRVFVGEGDRVETVVERFLAGQLALMSPDRACGGGGGGCGG